MTIGPIFVDFYEITWELQMCWSLVSIYRKQSCCC